MAMKILLLFLGAAFLFFFFSRLQHSLTYYPRAYSGPIPENVLPIHFITNEGEQTAYFLRPAAAGKILPQRFWIVFGGNASLALDWHSFGERYPDPESAFLLLDYPGYGQCKGKASEAAILESSEKAVESLADLLGIPRQKLDMQLHLVGHSLGAAAALQFAQFYPVHRIVLVAPFTCLKDMARLVVGWPLFFLAGNAYDNQARLVALFEKNSTVSVTILHGDHDEVVPVAMGRELAKRHGRHIVYEEIKNADHNSILDLAERDIYKAMLGKPYRGYQIEQDEE